MASIGPLAPGTLADDSGAGFSAWSNPGNAAVSDDTRATAGSLTTGFASHYLKATNFSFGVPAGSPIVGVVASIERRASGTGGVKDNIVSLVVGGVVSGSNQASASSWPASDASVDYGTVTYLWTLSLSSADVNAQTFGFV